jgi:c-di-GMP phosphodiesterase
VVAEGVEAEEQLAKLKEMGCDLVQGYYFAKPLPSKAIKELLANGAPL